MDNPSSDLVSSYMYAILGNPDRVSLDLCCVMVAQFLFSEIFGQSDEFIPCLRNIPIFPRGTLICLAHYLQINQSDLHDKER